MSAASYWASTPFNEGRRNSLLPQVDKVTRREKQPRVLHWPRPQQRERIYTTTDEPRGAEQQSLHHEHSSVSPRCQGLRHVHILADRDRRLETGAVHPALIRSISGCECDSSHVSSASHHSLERAPGGPAPLTYSRACHSIFIDDRDAMTRW